MGDKFGYEAQEQTEFNSNGATIYRIHEIKKMLAVTKVSGNLVDTFKHLVAFYMELESVLTPKEQEDQEIKFAYCTSQYNKIISQSRNKGDDIDYSCFIYWERDLRRLDQSHGLNMTKMSNPRYALSNRR